MTTDYKKYIRDLPDFPKPGIIFRDITPLLREGIVFAHAIADLASVFRGKADAIVGIEARGFVFGSAIAHHLSLGFIPIRKAGKLPPEIESITYELEYGSDCLEIRNDAFVNAKNVLLVDDLIATGGTAIASIDLLSKLKVKVCGIAAIIELQELGGVKKIEEKGIKVHTLVKY